MRTTYIGAPAIPQSAITSRGGGSAQFGHNRYCTGRITIDPEELPGTGPYTYTWGCGASGNRRPDLYELDEFSVYSSCIINEDNHSNEQTGLCNGNYTVTISDALNNCIGVASVTLDGLGFVEHPGGGVLIGPGGIEGIVTLVPAHFTQLLQIDYGVFLDPYNGTGRPPFFPGSLSVYTHTRSLVDQIPIEPLELNQTYTVPYDASALPLGIYFFELQVIVEGKAIREVAQGVKVSF